MKTSISYRYVHAHQPVAAEVAHHVAKLNRLLKSYEPDLVQLHGAFMQNSHSHREEHFFSINLALPTGSLHATGSGENPLGSCKQAFSELEGQLKRHQSLLRKDYEWKRKREMDKPSLE
jgi:ribosome-associated translation inhibitor RaiA